jgi:hypothetical protein
VSKSKRIKHAKSKYGRLEFRYSEGMSDRGKKDQWILNRIDAILNGKSVGHLKINYITRAMFSTAFPDIIHFLAYARGESALILALKKSDSKEVVKAMSKLAGEHLSQSDFDKFKRMDDADLNWWIEKYNVLLKKLNKLYGKEQKKFYDYWVDKPMVDYILVKEEYQKGGIAFGLYIAGAKWMAEKGMTLRSGASQSESAYHAWEKLKRAGLPVKTVNDAGIARSCLDLR